MILHWLRRWRRERAARARARALQRRAIPEPLWQRTLQRYPFLARRPQADLQALREMTSLFLDTKGFHGAGGFVVTDDIAVAVAAQACLPVLHLGLDYYRGFQSIVMHADEVVARRVIADEDGVVHEYDEPLVGEASIDTGQVMLAWAEVRDADELAGWGCNVVIHEFAHILDAINGEIDGVPGPMPSDKQAHWAEVLDVAYKRFCRRADRQARMLLDPYGAQSPDEFFAVLTEAFFVASAAMKKEQPAMYRLLCSYFQQDPAAAPSPQQDPRITP